MAIVVPGVPDSGVKKLIDGGNRNTNPFSAAVPPGVVTLMLPLAPVETTALIVADETVVNEEAATPPKLTAVAPVRFVPVIVTVAPLPADVGVNELIVGRGMVYINPAIVPVPPGAVTAIFPVAPEATMALITVSENTLKKLAGVPPKLTAVAPVKFLPVIVTVVPLVPEVGLK